MLRLIKPSLSQADIKAVCDVLESGMLVSGPVTAEFEEKLADYLEIEHAVCVSSGTAAITLSLVAAGIQPNDEVIIPAYTFPATANAIENLGAVPIFVDIEKNSVNIDVTAIEPKIGPKTRAIMPVHAFGIPADIEWILHLADKYKLTVIEDAACALGSRLDNQYCGTFGDMGTFSFHPRKLLTTGEGGMVVTSNSSLAAKIKQLRNHGYDGYEYNDSGYNFRLTDFQSAMGMNQLTNYDQMLAKRRHLAEIYNERLGAIDGIQIFESDPKTFVNVQTYIVKVASDFSRDELIIYLRNNGIETTIGTYCVPLTKYYRLKYGFTADEFPNAWDLFQTCLSLPLHNQLEQIDLAMVVDSISTFINKQKESLIAR